MRKVVCSLVILINSVYLFAQWKPVGGRIMTEWAAKIDVENVLPEYPRPIMERADWINLNGLWSYATKLWWSDFSSFCCRIKLVRSGEKSWGEE